MSKWIVLVMVFLSILSGYTYKNTLVYAADEDYGNLDAQEYGDAVYRRLSWLWAIGYNYNHAGIIAGINSSDSLRVIEAPVADNNPDNEFLGVFKNGDQPYYGAYTLSSFTLSFSSRKQIVKIARDLVAANIGYPSAMKNALEPIGDFFTGYVDDIDTIRCDGVVEYCYEYPYDGKTGYRVWWHTSRPDDWNIATPSSLAYHNYMPGDPISPDTELSPWAQRGSPPNTGPVTPFGNPHADNLNCSTKNGRFM